MLQFLQSLKLSKVIRNEENTVVSFILCCCGLEIQSRSLKVKLALTVDARSVSGREHFKSKV